MGRRLDSVVLLSPQHGYVMLHILNLQWVADRETEFLEMALGLAAIDQKLGFSK